LNEKSKHYEERTWSLLYVLLVVKGLRIAGLTTNIAPTELNRYLEGTDCYSLQKQQSELIATRRGNISTAFLRSSGAL
jgi:hypothetical protein